MVGQALEPRMCRLELSSGKLVLTFVQSIARQNEPAAYPDPAVAKPDL